MEIYFLYVQVLTEDLIKLESVSKKCHHILCVSNIITSRYNGHIVSLYDMYCLHSSINLYTHLFVHAFIYSSIHSSNYHWTWVHVHSHYVHILIPIQVHRYLYPMYVHVLMESCTVLRYKLKMAVTDSVFVIYLQTKCHSYIPHKALRVRKYFILIGHAMSCDYYITRGAMWSFCLIWNVRHTL